MRKRYFWDREVGDWVEYRPRHDRPNGPMVISDTIEATLNPADGRRYDSKRAYERAVRRAGCEIVGNERMPERRPIEPRGVGQDIKRAMEQLGV